MNFYFLYTRLPGYFLACLESLIARGDDVTVYCIVHKPSGDAPYNHKRHDRIKIIYKEDQSAEQLNNLFKQRPPSVIYVSGWIDKSYLRIAREYQKRIPVIVGMDNPWKGTLKQRLATVIAPKMLRRTFNYIWVPGNRQYEFARRLGFNQNQILKGLYCADERLFGSSTESKYRTRTVLFVGRLIDYKHPIWIVKAFSDFYKEGKYADWKAVLIGNGPLNDTLNKIRENHERINIIQFVQPSEIIEYYNAASVFCLPSSNEHWGVVIHEAAQARLPLLLSDSCGAADEFMIHGYNGYLFETGNYHSFRQHLEKLLQLSEADLETMGNASKRLADRVNHESWCATLLSVTYT